MKRTPRPLFYVLLLLLWALDQGTKYWARTTLGAGDTEFAASPHVVLPGFFNLIFVRNTGIAFSLFTGNNLVWLGIAVVFVAAAIWFSPRLDWRTRRMNVVAALLGAGALGNLTDRVLLGYVVDFLDFHWRGAHYPTFNVADSCLTVGVVWVLLRTLFARRPQGGGEVSA